MNGALDGIRVLDFSALLPGPLATLCLADLGAEVIKVERPGHGDEMRTYAPKWGADSANFHILNRGKKSIALDLRKPDQRKRLLPLVRNCDVIVEQYRPGVMDRLGLGYRQVRDINPDIIYCSITGYGQHGPKSLSAGHDLNYIAETGLLALSHGSADTPVLPPALLADVAGGAYPALINILLALRARNRSGQGAHLDIAMAENIFPFLYWAQAEGQVSGTWPDNADALVTGGSPRYQLYPTSDGGTAVVAALEPKFWDTFCDLIGLETALREDHKDASATRERIATLIAAKPTAHWKAAFEDADCCCCILKDLQAAMGDPHFRARGLFSEEQENEHGARVPSLPTPLADHFRTRRKDVTRAPRLGEDTNRLAPLAEGNR